MKEYRSNSDAEKKSREKAEKPKEVKTVIKDEAHLQKQGFVGKMIKTFIPDDPETIAERIVQEVIVPSVKNTLYNIITNGGYILLNDDSNSLRKSITRTAYGNIFVSDTDRITQPPNGRKDIGYRNYKSGTQAYDSVSFSTRPDAEVVLEAMLDIIDGYDSVSIAEYYDLAGIPNDNYTLNNYGWTDLSNARIIQVRNRYTIKLPKAVQLRQGR